MGLCKKMEAIDWRLCPQTDQLDQTEHFQMLYLGHFRWFWAPKVGILYLENFLDVQNHLEVRKHLHNFVFVSMCCPAEKVFGFFKFSEGAITPKRLATIEVLEKSSLSLSLILLAKGFDGAEKPAL